MRTEQFRFHEGKILKLSAHFVKELEEEKLGKDYPVHDQDQRPWQMVSPSPQDYNRLYEHLRGAKIVEHDGIASRG